MSSPLNQADLIRQENGAVYHLGLFPEQVPDLILTVGDPQRVPMVSRHFDAVEERVAHREFVTHIGRVGNRPLMVTSSGMGTDNVEILLTELDALVNLDWSSRTFRSIRRRLTVIRLGTSGALSPEVPLDSLLVSQTAFGLDTLMQFYPPVTPPELVPAVREMKEQLSLEFTPYAAIADPGLLSRFQSSLTIGHTVTCPGFYAPQGRSLWLSPRQNQLVKTLAGIRVPYGSITNLEMETAGYYALGKLFSHRMLSLNAILAHRTHHSFSSNPEKTINRMIEQTFLILDSG